MKALSVFAGGRDPTFRISHLNPRVWHLCSFKNADGAKPDNLKPDNLIAISSDTAYISMTSKHWQISIDYAKDG